jgi:hypothetical protein
MKVEVVVPKQKSIDWENPQLVVNGDLIVMVTKEQKYALNERSFCAVDIRTGMYVVDFLKNSFRPFDGSVTLKND